MFNLKLHDPYFLPHLGCDVELSLNAQDVVTIIGENGLGKTTLLQRLYRDSGPLMSMIEQRSLDLFYDRPLKKLKAIFIESSKSIDESFFLGCWESFGLSKKEDRMLSSLSGGESQALKISLGLSSRSDIYVLDEPSQYLDHNMKNVLNDALQKLRDKKKAILIVEHDLSWQKFPMKVIQLAVKDKTLVKGKEWST